MEKCYALKGQSLVNGLLCIFQAINNILNQKQKQSLVVQWLRIYTSIRGKELRYCMMSGAAKKKKKVKIKETYPIWKGRETG